MWKSSVEKWLNRNGFKISICMHWQRQIVFILFIFFEKLKQYESEKKNPQFQPQLKRVNEIEIERKFSKPKNNVHILATHMYNNHHCIMWNGLIFFLSGLLYVCLDMRTCRAYTSEYSILNAVYVHFMYLSLFLCGICEWKRPPRPPLKALSPPPLMPTEY